MQRRDATIAALAFLLAVSPAEAAPKVAASIAPLAGVAAAVMGEDGPPVLLLPPGRPPHSVAFPPSQARALAEADVVLWIGPGMETGLEAALGAMPPAWVAQHALTVLYLRGVARKPSRDLGASADTASAVHAGHGAPAGGHGDAPAEGHGGHGGVDPHLWLDPANAAAIARALAERLAIIEPARAGIYRANAERFAASTTALSTDIAEMLAPVRGRRFVVFHDAYQYFEVPFGLEAVAALALEPGQPIGGRRLDEVRARARETGAACVFADAQAPEGAVDGIARDLGLKPGLLDPLGAPLEPGVDSYATLLKRLAEAYRSCLVR